MIEPEIAFATLKEDMDLQEEMVKYIISAVLEECPEEMNFLNSFVDKGLIERLKFVRDSEFVRCPYTEAIDILDPLRRESSNTPSSGAATSRRSTSGILPRSISASPCS